MHAISRNENFSSKGRDEWGRGGGGGGSIVGGGGDAVRGRRFESHFQRGHFPRLGKVAATSSPPAPWKPSPVA